MGRFILGKGRANKISNKIISKRTGLRDSRWTEGILNVVRHSVLSEIEKAPSAKWLDDIKRIETNSIQVFQDRM